ncbi:MAG: hypothetical protein HKN58_06090 [Xanthomonadales bacterium]|nr:hypothetical protein [Xanthomonadales bacterium]
MSLEARRTKLVYSVIEDLVAGGQSDFLPGDVNSALRRDGQPLGTWEVRAEFSTLADEGLIELDPASAR